MASNQPPMDQDGSQQPGDRCWRMQKIIEGGRIGTWEWNVETGEILLNETWAAIGGYSLEELSPLTVDVWRRLCHPEDLERARPMLQRHLGGELPGYEMDSRMLRKDGSWVWVLDRGSVSEWTEDHRPRWICGVRLEIAGRKEAQAVLTASNAKLEAALGAMTDAVFIADAQGNIVDFNEAFATFHRFRNLAELQGALPSYRKTLQFFLADGRPAPHDQRPMTRALRGETGANVEYRLVRTDTGQTWLASYSFSPLREPDGDITGAVVTARDVTQLKLAERSLASALERLDLATQAVGMGIWDWDLQANHLVWDDQMHSLFGTRRQDFPGASEAWAASVHAEDRARAEAEAAAALSGTKDYDTEFRVVLPDGAIRHIKAQGVVVRGADGAAVRMIGVNRDVTSQRQQEQDRAHLENQLAQAQRLESIGRLAGGVAHDFNNMLGVILAQAELGMEDLDPKNPLYEALAEIERTAERSANLTRQLLAFARKQTIDPKVLDLNESVAGLYKMLSRLIDESVVLAWRPGPQVWPVRMDPTQVDQVLANLCVNARDAIRGPGRISIQTGNATLSLEDCAANPDCQPGDYAWMAVGEVLATVGGVTSKLEPRNS